MKTLVWLIGRFDSRLRHADFFLHRTRGGLLSHIGIHRHTTGVLILPVLVCGIVVAASPVSGSRHIYAVFTMLAVLMALAVLTRWSGRNKLPLAVDLFIQIAIVALVSATVWYVGGNQFQVNAVYRHIFIPVVAILLITLAVAPLLAWSLFKNLFAANNLSECVKRTELFKVRGAERAATLVAMLRSALTVPLRAPHQLLLPPAIAVLVLPPDLLREGTLWVLIAAFIALFFGGLNDRFGIMWRLLESGFFRGGALLVSVIIIVFAALRIAQVSYVKTVLDTRAGQVIIFTFFSAYAISWWFDYWVKRLLTQKAFQLVTNRRVHRACALYRCTVNRDQSGTTVPMDHRLLQVHGSSRLIVMRRAEPNKRFKWYFQAYQIAEFMEMLGISGAPGGNANPLPVQVKARSFDYYSVIGTLVVLLAGFGMLWLHKRPQLSEVTAKFEALAGKNPETGLALDSLIKQRCDSGQPIIVIAASGGGTRAALYTASVLEGLNRENALGNVLLGSGVSGGGAALAYFASNPKKLAGGDETTWDKYFEILKKSFIRDVLERASEWRIVSDGRLGILLKESFRSGWGLDEGHNKLRDIQGMGLILNTSLAGHFDRSDVDASDNPGKLALNQLESRHPELSKSELAGGRLVFTNLRVDKEFAGEALERHGKHALPIFINDPDIRLEDAAALNANFPPVFSNAAVDVDDQVRYWVTDGGVVDNRGMEMALYALRSSLDTSGCTRFPRMFVIVADASAYSNAFSQTRGVNTLLAAGSKFASQLALEIKNTIQARYKAHNQEQDFSFTYLSMPQILRASDSFGTHWMLQPSITVHHFSTQLNKEESEVVSGDEMITVMRSLYSDKPTKNISSAASTVLAWAKEENSDWHDLQQLLHQQAQPTPKPRQNAPDKRRRTANQHP